MRMRVLATLLAAGPPADRRQSGPSAHHSDSARPIQQGACGCIYRQITRSFTRNSNISSLRETTESLIRRVGRLPRSHFGAF